MAGLVILTGADLILSGAYVPVAGNSFTVVRRKGEMRAARSN